MATYQMRGGMGYLWRFRAEHNPGGFANCCQVYLPSVGHTVVAVRTLDLANDIPGINSYELHVTGNGGFTPYSVVNPDGQLAITCVGIACPLGGTYDRNGWVWSKMEVRWKSSTYDTDTAAYVADGAVEVRFQENVLVTRTGLLIQVPNEATADFQIHIHPVGGDIDQVWILNDYVYATAADYDDDSVTTVVTSPALLFTDTFDTGLDPSWLAAYGGGGGATLPYWRSDTGKNESGGLTHNNLDEDGSPVPGASYVGYTGVYREFLYDTPDPPGSGPVVDTTVPCECTPGGANPTTVPDPLLPFAPVYTCVGGGTVEALADLPGIGGCWL